MCHDPRLPLDGLQEAQVALTHHLPHGILGQRCREGMKRKLLLKHFLFNFFLRSAGQECPLPPGAHNTQDQLGHLLRSGPPEHGDRRGPGVRQRLLRDTGL